MKTASPINNFSREPSPEGAPLVVRFGHLGDVILATGVLAYYGREQGRQFDILTRKAWACVFDGHPFVRCVHTLPDKPGTVDEVRFFRSLARRYQGRSLIDLHGNLRSRLLRAVWKGQVCGYDKMGLARRLFAASSGRFCGAVLRDSNVPQRYAAAFDGAKTPPPAEALLPVVYVKESEAAWAQKTLKEALKSTAGSAQRPVALHPFASHEPKTWPAERWRRLARLLERENIPWIAVGSGEDVFGGTKGNFINKTSLRQSAALLAESRALVTGDSGPMHLASAAGTPVVALFGPTTREWGFYPAGEYDTVLEADVACRPCSLHGKGTCASPCLESIAPEIVLEALMKKG